MTGVQTCALPIYGDGRIDLAVAPAAGPVHLLHNRTATKNHWIEIAHGEAKRLAQPWHIENRLWTVWSEVARNLAADWTLGRLARLYRTSAEQFRRVCLRDLGRSPMQHLTSLRIEEACRLLAATDDKVETIARQVGFDEASVFSRVFKRWVGRSPKAYRE